MTDTTARPHEGAATRTESADRRRSRSLVLRLHFYAGVFVGPFLIIAALSGTAYALAPPLESWLYHDELTATSHSAPLPLADQVRAAQDVAPDGNLHAVRPAPEPGATTRVLFTRPGLGDSEWDTVFVDPGNGAITGELTTYGTSGVLPLRMTLDQLHRNLLLGEPGRIYSELAASWLWVVALAGLALWLTRRRPATAARAGRTPGTGRARTARRHSRLGVYVLVGALLLSATGLTWSTYAGAHVTDLRDALGWTTPEVDASGDGTHAGPHHGNGDHAGHGAAVGAHQPTDPADPARADEVLRVARAADIDAGRIELTPPADARGDWSVAEIDRSWPTQVDAVAVDPVRASVTDEVRFADYPLAAKLARWGVDLHMGTLFGWPNRLALAALGIALTTLIVLGYRMWWQRGRGAFGPAVPRGQWRSLPRTALWIGGCAAAAVGWLLPLLGLSVVAFLVVDVLIGHIRSRRA